MNTLVWNNNKDRYEGVTSEGKRIAVQGDEMSEAVQDGGNLEDLCEDTTLWEGLIGGNQNVFYIDENGREIE